VYIFLFLFLFLFFKKMISSFLFLLKIIFKLLNCGTPNEKNGKFAVRWETVLLHKCVTVCQLSRDLGKIL
jgi:hypothetical protein